MDVSYICQGCEHSNRREFTGEAGEGPTCAQCGASVTRESPAVVDGRLTRCVVCPCEELFVRKDFSPRWGLTIIILGFAASCIPWAMHRPVWTFVILGATALLDLALYSMLGNVLQCYRCRAEYRGVPDLQGHEAFELETHERYRQQEARLAESQTAPLGADSRPAGATETPTG